MSRRSPLLLPLLVLAACSPSPAQLRASLAKHPEILAEAIRAHPAEIMRALQAAADSYQRITQASAERDEDARITRELADPRRPVLEPGRAVRGPADAPVTIVEYSDFQCPYCRRDVPVIRRLLAKYPGKVRVVLKQTPLPLHDHAREAALMFEAVLRQGQELAWRYHDLLFANQERLASEGESFLDAAARQVGADVARARRDAQSDAVQRIVDADLAEFDRFGFAGTPGFVVNGVMLDGSRPIEAFDRIIARVLATEAPPPALARPGPGATPPVEP